jgi:hypothetical protein
MYTIVIIFLLLNIVSAKAFVQVRVKSALNFNVNENGHGRQVRSSLFNWGPKMNQKQVISKQTKMLSIKSLLPSASKSQLKAMVDERVKLPTKIERNNLVQNLFMGVNAKGLMKNVQPGDTRSEIAMLLNGLSMCVILGVWFSIAYVFSKSEESSEFQLMRKEVEKEKRYREVKITQLYFIVLVSFVFIVFPIVVAF